MRQSASDGRGESCPPLLDRIQGSCRRTVGRVAPVRPLKTDQSSTVCLKRESIVARRSGSSDAGRLTLEITESTILQGDDAVLSVLNRLREQGVTIALDDFGTGYSSMSYLRRFPFDTLKIDRSFIRDAADRSDSAAIVRAIASLASSLGMKTVAEGVETNADLDMVRAAGCSHVQGYLFSRPVPVTSLAAVLASLTSEIRSAAA